MSKTIRIKRACEARTFNRTGRSVGYVFAFFSESLTASQKKRKLYIVNCWFFWESYGKIKINVHFYQKVALFVFIFEYFTFALL